MKSDGSGGGSGSYRRGERETGALFDGGFGGGEGGGGSGGTAGGGGGGSCSGTAAATSDSGEHAHSKETKGGPAVQGRAPFAGVIVFDVAAQFYCALRHGECSSAKSMVAFSDSSE
jgi:hypothetical protein